MQWFKNQSRKRKVIIIAIVPLLFIWVQLLLSPTTDLLKSPLTSLSIFCKKAKKFHHHSNSSAKIRAGRREQLHPIHLPLCWPGPDDQPRSRANPNTHARRDTLTNRHPDRTYCYARVAY